MKPLLRGRFHEAMFYIALGALIPLIVNCHTIKETIAISIYAFCALTMFGVSSLYHRINWNEQKRLLLKKLDHAGIYLMIAGSFTPIAMLSLPEATGQTILITIWAVAFIGILQSIFFVNMPKVVSSIFYIIAGYQILPYLSEVQTALGMNNLLLLMAGGISYTVGAICYALKWPALSPKVFGYHEVFHILVNLGALLHFIVISSLIF